MRRLIQYARTAIRYARFFSWKRLLLFKLNDWLVSGVSHPRMRRTRALRVFAYTVPLETMALEDGEYRFHYELNGRRPAFALRADSSDVEVFLQVIRYGEYADVTRLLRAHRAPARIVDAGANIGLSTVYFKCFHPEAHVAALEPEAENFRRLARTVAENQLADVTLIQEGLWTRDTRLQPDRTFRDGEAWSFSLREDRDRTGEDGIPVVSLDSLLSRLGWGEVDLLKIDIEGGEGHLMRDRSFLTTLTERVALVCMEVHEEAIRRAEVIQTLESIGMECVGGKEYVLGWKPARR